MRAEKIGGVLGKAVQLSYVKLLSIMEFFDHNKYGYIIHVKCCVVRSMEFTIAYNVGVSHAMIISRRVT